jgi:hypothetical protein
MMEKRIIDVATEDRFAALEKKCRDLEAGVKGLTQELVDLKSLSMKMSKQIEEHNRQDLKASSLVRESQTQTSASGGQVLPTSSTTVMIRKGAKTPDKPAEPVFDNILQPDGTIEKEPRRGDKKPIVASTGYERTKKGTSVKAKQSALIIAMEKSKADTAKK